MILYSNFSEENKSKNVEYKMAPTVSVSMRSKRHNYSAVTEKKAKTNKPGPFLVTRINFDPSVDK